MGDWVQYPHKKYKHPLFFTRVANESRTHMLAATILPPCPHIAFETRTPVIQHVHFGILLTNPVPKPSLGLDSNHDVHRVEVYFQVFLSLPCHHMLRAPCTSVLVMTQPATKNKRFSEAKLIPLRQYLTFETLYVN